MCIYYIINITDIMSHDKYICPITKLIFKDPVVTAEGHIYERTAIKRWFKSNNISPLTGNIISAKVYPVLFLKNEIACYLEKHPDLKKEQYIKIFDPKEIFAIIETKKFRDLYDYSEFKLRYCFSDNDLLSESDSENGSNIQEQLREQIMQHIDNGTTDSDTDSDTYVDMEEQIRQLREHIDNGYNGTDVSDEIDSTIHEHYEYTSNNDDGINGYNFIKILLLQCNDNKIIKYVLDNSLDLWIKSDKKKKLCDLPFHQICIHGDIEIIKYALLKSKSIPCFTNKLLNIRYYENYWAPIIFISKRCPKNLELLELFADFKVNLESKDCCKCHPIHHYCENGNSYTINFLVSKGVQLNCIDAHNRQPINLLLTNKNVELDFIKSFVKKIICNNGPTICNEIPLYLASLRPDMDTKLLKMLCNNFKMSSDSEIEETNKTCPVHIACMHSNKNIIEYLINNTPKKFIRRPISINVTFNLSGKITDEFSKSILVNINQLLYMNENLDKKERDYLTNLSFQKKKKNKRKK